jgi:hypothetical protein
MTAIDCDMCCEIVMGGNGAGPANVDVYGLELFT